MGYQVQAGAPQITVGGVTYCVGVAKQVDVLAPSYHIGIFRLDGGAWVIAKQLIPYDTAGDFVKHVQAKGGIVKFCAWVVGEVNALFAFLFATPVPVVEPTTDDEALAAVGTFLNGLKLTVNNGVPVLGQ